MTNTTNNYSLLNDLAEKNGIVIFGGNEDLDIPVGELKQAFSIQSNIYNRSMANLSILNAINIYDTYILPLMPETIRIHIGSHDLDFFHQDPSAFVQKFRELIAHIRLQNTKCRIGIISLKNYENDINITEINTSNIFQNPNIVNMGISQVNKSGIPKV